LITESSILVSEQCSGISKGVYVWHSFAAAVWKYTLSMEQNFT